MSICVFHNGTVGEFKILLCQIYGLNKNGTAINDRILLETFDAGCLIF